MSLLSSFGKKSKLAATLRQTAEARKSEGNVADSLYKGAYKGYAEVLLDDPLRADALYHWGFALLHHANIKTGNEAVKLLQDAIAKFSFCLLLNPNYLGSALNGGVAYMELARLTGVKPDDELYDLAKKQFEVANDIQKGVASYNLACIFALRGDHDACLQALEYAKNHGSLPELSDMQNDPDLDSVKPQAWFEEFINNLNASSSNDEVIAESSAVEKLITEESAATEAVVVESQSAVEEMVTEKEVAPAEAVTEQQTKAVIAETQATLAETVPEEVVVEEQIEEIIANDESTVVQEENTAVEETTTETVTPEEESVASTPATTKHQPRPSHHGKHRR